MPMTLLQRVKKGTYRSQTVFIMKTKTIIKSNILKVSGILFLFLSLTGYSPSNYVQSSYDVPRIYLSSLLNGNYKNAYTYISLQEGPSNLTFEKYISIIKKTIEQDRVFYEKKGFHFIKRTYKTDSFKILSHLSLREKDSDERTEVYQVSYNFEDTLQHSGQEQLFSVVTWNIVSTFYVKDLKIKHITQDYKRAVRLKKAQYI